MLSFHIIETAQLEVIMKELFQISKDANCRVWHCNMSSTYEELSIPEQTLQDAGNLYRAGQLIAVWSEHECKWV